MKSNLASLSSFDKVNYGLASVAASALNCI